MHCDPIIYDLVIVYSVVSVRSYQHAAIVLLQMLLISSRKTNLRPSTHHAVPVAYECHPRILVSIWTLVICVQGLLSLASLKVRSGTTVQGGCTVTSYLFDVNIRNINDKSTHPCCIFYHTETLYQKSLLQPVLYQVHYLHLNS